MNSWHVDQHRPIDAVRADLDAATIRVDIERRAVWTLAHEQDAPQGQDAAQDAATAQYRRAAAWHMPALYEAMKRRERFMRELFERVNWP